MDSKQNTYKETSSLFENAYFGKTYITKDNTIVKFILQDKDFVLLYIPKCKYSIETTHRYNPKGEFYLGDGEYGHGSLDVICEWTEEITEEEVKSALTEATKYEYNKSYYCASKSIGVNYFDIGFDAGYRKAKEK